MNPADELNQMVATSAPAPDADQTLTTDALSYYPPGDFPPGESSAAALAAAAQASMEAEWACGNPVPAAWYFEHAPALANDPSAAIDVAFLEFVLREEAGEEPTPVPFAARFPALAPRLRALLDLDAALTAATATATATATVTTSDERAVLPLGALGRYLLVAELGGGGQGDVFRAVHPTLGREVVIKRLRADVEAGSGAAERLATEGRVLAGLDHPNLAKVYDLEVADGRPFMVMELVRGRSLHEVRRHAPVAAADAARWVAAVARAAAHAHARGVLHLDIKPRNVVLDDTGRVVLLDFGLARVDHGLEPPGPDAGVSGTLAYMAPEQARGENDRLGPPADVYGLGGVLYYLLTGTAPIPGTTASEVYGRARTGSWDRPPLAASGAPARLVRVCERALDPNPANRFPSGVALADALEATVRPRRWLVAAGALVAAAALIGVGVAAWPKTPGVAAPVNPPAPPVAAPAPPAKKPDLRFAFGIYRANKLFADFPTPFAVGERGRVTATVPANHHATLILATEPGSVKELGAAGPQPSDHAFAYPPSPDPKRAELMRFAEPAGTHVFLLFVSASGPVSTEQLGLKPGEAWPRLPYDTVIRIAGGRAVVEVKGRDVEPGGAVADPEGETVARLEKLLRAAPADVTVEGVVIAVKPR